MRRSRVISLILLATHLPACSSYRLVADPATAIATAPKPIKAVRVTYPSGTQVVLKAPVVDGDSLRGIGSSGASVSVALADISLVGVKTPNSTKTFGLVMGILVVAFGAFIGAAAIIINAGA